MVHLLAGAFALWLSLAATDGAAGTGGPSRLPSTEWAAYKTRFIMPEGRVVDTGNGGFSHSEGQGAAMVLATAFGDHATFARLWRWTERELQVRDDSLFAGCWEPRRPGEGHITDDNNATNGDLLIAWALLRADRRWHSPAYRQAAHAILEDVRRLLIADTALGPVLVPAAEGFRRSGAVVVNPSHWIFPALTAFAEDEPAQPLWVALHHSGIRLVETARFGAGRLPPDWLEITETVRPAARFNPTFGDPVFGDPVFGADAIRVPLHAVWGGVDDALLAPFRHFWSRFDGRPQIPATLNLETGAESDEVLSQGGRAIVVLTRFAAAAPDRARSLLPRIGPRDDTGSATLILLSALALEERGRP